MKKAIAITAVILLGMVVFILPQKKDSAIRILIDRAPNGLVPGQVTDIAGRRFLPLLEEYSLQPQSNNQEWVFKSKIEGARPDLKFIVVKDESTRALKFFKGEGDVLYDSLSLSKTHWLEEKAQDMAFQVYQRPGLNLSFIGFSHRHPILKLKAVREAIARALPVQDWIQYKLFNWVEAVPDLTRITFDRERSRLELDRLGYTAHPETGTRFKLKYFTTGVKEGMETALLVQEALRKVEIEVEVVTLDTLLFFQKLKKGEADLFSMRWFRFNQNEPIQEYLATAGNRNYLGYSNPKLDERLKQNPALSKDEFVQLIENDFPFFPLYQWKHGLITSPRVRIQNREKLLQSLDETFRFLLELELQSSP